MTTSTRSVVPALVVLVLLVSQTMATPVTRVPRKLFGYSCDVRHSNCGKSGATGCENDECCGPTHKCGLYQGDCDSDADCGTKNYVGDHKSQLICGTNNCPWGGYDDCCTDPVCDNKDGSASCSQCAARIAQGCAWCPATQRCTKSGDDTEGSCPFVKGQAVKGTSGYNCVFPFTYKGNTYNACTNAGGENYLWCGTTSNFDTDGKWDYCPSPKTTQCTGCDVIGANERCQETLPNSHCESKIGAHATGCVCNIPRVNIHGKCELPGGSTTTCQDARNAEEELGASCATKAKTGWCLKAAYASTMANYCPKTCALCGSSS